MFKIGDTVVHPQHGVGQVTRLEERQFEPKVTRRYYEISIPGGSTVWVPIDLPGSGLRKLADKRELARCREILQSQPLPLAEEGRVRQSTLAAHLKQGTLAAQCEVVRDLSGYCAHKPINVPIASFLQAVQGVLCQEWALVEGIPLSTATHEVSVLLEKSRLTAKERMPKPTSKHRSPGAAP
jgi:CarD family transcriptional regulator